MKYITVLTVLLLSFPAFAQESTVHKDTLSLTVYFRQSLSDIDLTFRENGKNIPEFMRKVDALNADRDALIHAINITTGASPEGTYEFNRAISMKRARAIRDYLLDNTTLAPAQIKTFSLGVDWEGLEKLIKEGDDPAKEKILDIIRTGGPKAGADGRTADTRVEMLKQLENGRAWSRLERDLFGNLRHAGGKVSCIVSSRDGRKMFFENRKDTLVIIHKDTVYNYVFNCPTTAQANDGHNNKNPRRFKKDSLFRTPAVAFRSNLLVPLMNIGIEIPLSNRTSLEADFYSPWVMREWMDRFTTAHKNCFQLVLGTIGYRFWTGKLHDRRDGNPRYRLRGHSIGIVASGGVYDLERNWKGQQGRFAVLGVDYLYGLPLGKGGMHLEFNAGIGYGINWYNDYIVRREGGKLINDGGKRVRNLPFPVRLGISIAVPVFRKNKMTESREEQDND